MNDYRKEYAHRTREKILSDEHAYTDGDGVRRWRSNDAVIPLCVYRDAQLEPPAFQRAAQDREDAAFVKRYREARAKHGYSAEERFEMRATYGPGAEVVDIITGERIRV